MAYKTFTSVIPVSNAGAHMQIDTQDASEEIRRIFDMVTTKKDRFFEILSEGKRVFTTLLRDPVFKDYEKVPQILSKQQDDIHKVFEDYKKRCEYFTMVLFGAVGAGKTSLICDLTGRSPAELTSCFQNNPNFETGLDNVVVDCRVATINLYEMLLEDCHLRLVDVPGIGGVVHENDTLAPFVDLADMIIFLLDANSAITKNDKEFLEQNMVYLDQKSSVSAETDENSRRSTRLIVALNKWETARNGLNEEQKEKEYQKYSKWVLDGDGKGFLGIAGIFDKTPEVVRTNTSARYEGEICTPSNISELIQTINDIINSEGISLRTQRPIRVLTSSVLQILNTLEDFKDDLNTDNFQQKLNDLKQDIHEAKSLIKFDTKSCVARAVDSIENQLRNLLYNWTPEPGFLESLGAIFLEKKKNELRKKYERILNDLLKNGMAHTLIDVQNNVEQEVALYLNQLSSELENILIDMTRKQNLLNYRAYKQIRLELPQENLTGQLRETASSIQNESLKDLQIVLSINTMLAIAFGVLLGPISSFFAKCLGKTFRKTSEATWKQGVDDAIEEAIPLIRKSLKEKISHSVKKPRNKMIEKAMSLIEEQTIVRERPRKELEKITSNLEALVQELNKTQEQIMNM